MKFELFLFSTDILFVQAAVAAGVAGVVVDWERIGKEERQRGYDTQIGTDTLEDLRRVRAATSAKVICRINPFGPYTRSELTAAVEAGADEVLLPMVRSPKEVEQVLEWARGRVGVGILVETMDAVRQAEALARLPLTRVYVGLHDLAIERGTPNPFRAVSDGIVEHLRRLFSVPFGFAGLTLPDRGFPIPCRWLIAEMARLRCQFSFLRRSFLRDIVGRDLSAEVPRLLTALQAAFGAPADVLAEAHRELLKAIEEAEPYFRARNTRHHVREP